MTAPVTVACLQAAPKVGADGANRVTALDAVHSAVAAGARLIVLPELVTSGYSFDSTEEVQSAALARDDSWWGELRSLVAPVDGVVVAGVPLRRDPGVSNSAIVVGADGVLAVYDKVHLWGNEVSWFVPGAAPPPVVETAIGRIGVLVCYDLEFPEMTRSLALRGADVIVVPTNWPLSPRPEGERPSEMGNAMVLARLSRVAIACADRCGMERGQEWTGGSCIVDADGWIQAERPLRDPGPVIASIDLTASRDKRVSPLNDLISDRRPEVYVAGATP